MSVSAFKGYRSALNHVFALIIDFHVDKVLTSLVLLGRRDPMSETCLLSSGVL